MTTTTLRGIKKNYEEEKPRIPKRFKPESVINRRKTYKMIAKIKRRSPYDYDYLRKTRWIYEII